MKKQTKKSTPAKKKQQRIFIGIVIAIVIIILIIRFKKKTADSTEIQAEISNASTGTTPTAEAPKYSSSGLRILGNTATLKKGTKSAEVRWVQNDFNQRIAKPNKYTLLSEDGIFGAKTEYAVNSVIKKKQTSWAEWKTKVDAIVANRK